MTPGSNRGAPGTARPKGSGFNRACEPASHAERHLDRHMRTQAEDADVAAAHGLVIVGGVDAEHAEAHVRPDGVPEVRVARSGRPARAESGGNVRLDAQDRKSTGMNSSRSQISYAVVRLKKKKK